MDCPKKTIEWCNIIHHCFIEKNNKFYKKNERIPHSSFTYACLDFLRVFFFSSSILEYFFWLFLVDITNDDGTFWYFGWITLLVGRSVGESSINSYVYFLSLCVYLSFSFLFFFSALHTKNTILVYRDSWNNRLSIKVEYPSSFISIVDISSSYQWEMLFIFIPHICRHHHHHDSNEWKEWWKTKQYNTILRLVRSFVVISFFTLSDSSLLSSFWECRFELELTHTKPSKQQELINCC